MYFNTIQQPRKWGQGRFVGVQQLKQQDGTVPPSPELIYKLSPGH